MLSLQVKVDLVRRMSFPAFANGAGTETVKRVTALAEQLSAAVIKRNIRGRGRGEEGIDLTPTEITRTRGKKL